MSPLKYVIIFTKLKTPLHYYMQGVHFGQVNKRGRLGKYTPLKSIHQIFLHGHRMQKSFFACHLTLYNF